MSWRDTQEDYLWGRGENLVCVVWVVFTILYLGAHVAAWALR